MLIFAYLTCFKCNYKRFINRYKATCGVPVHKPKLSSTFRIVGGMPAVANSWPWQVYLSIDDITIGCGAALITDQWLGIKKLLLKSLFN